MGKGTCLAWMTAFLVLCMEFIQSACKCYGYNAWQHIDAGHGVGYIQVPRDKWNQREDTVLSSHQYCRWTIQADICYGIKLKIVESDLTCDNGYVDVFDDMNERELLLGRNCGSDMGKTYTSKWNKMTVVFVSDETNQFRGFRAKFETVPIACKCYEFNSPLKVNAFWTSDQYIQMPRGGWYNSNQICEWNIQTDKEGYGIRLKTVEFDLQDRDITGECKNDYVDVFDDVNGRKMFLGRNCGSDVGSTYTSRGNKMTVKFVSDETLQFRGFKVAYAVVPIDKFISEERKRVQYLSVGLSIGLFCLFLGLLYSGILTKCLKWIKAAARSCSNTSATPGSSCPDHSLPIGSPAPGSSTSVVGSNVNIGERVLDNGSYSSDMLQQVALPRNVQDVPRTTPARSITPPPTYNSLDFSQEEGREHATLLPPPPYEVAVQQHMGPFSD